MDGTANKVYVFIYLLGTAMDINNKETAPAEDSYFTPAFNQLIEDNLTYLRTQQQTTISQLSNVQCVKFAGDFYGLLVDLLIDKKYHYPIMRVNNYLSSTDFNGNISQVIIPNLPEIDRLMQTTVTGF